MQKLCKLIQTVKSNLGRMYVGFHDYVEMDCCFYLTVIPFDRLVIKIMKIGVDIVSFIAYHCSQCGNNDS